MTSETRTFVEAKDIAGIEVECRRCRSTVFYPIATLADERKLKPSCLQCGDSQFDMTPIDTESSHIQHPSYPAINDLLRIASALRSLVQERTDIHAGIRFRIDAEVSGK